MHMSHVHVTCKASRGGDAAHRGKVVLEAHLEQPVCLVEHEQRHAREATGGSLALSLWRLGARRLDGLRVRL